MKILVTGPAGYIGSKLVPMLLNDGHDVIGFDNLTFGYHTLIPYLGKKNFKFIFGDVTKLNDHKDLFENLDGIIHLAAIVGFPACHKNPELANEIESAIRQNAGLVGDQLLDNSIAESEAAKVPVSRDLPEQSMFEKEVGLTSELNKDF